MHRVWSTCLISCSSCPPSSPPFATLRSTHPPLSPPDADDAVPKLSTSRSRWRGTRSPVPRAFIPTIRLRGCKYRTHSPSRIFGRSSRIPTSSDGSTCMEASTRRTSILRSPRANASMSARRRRTPSPHADANDRRRTYRDYDRCSTRTCLATRRGRRRRMHWRRRTARRSIR